LVRGVALKLLFDHELALPRCPQWGSTTEGRVFSPLERSTLPAMCNSWRK